MVLDESSSDPNLIEGENTGSVSIPDDDTSGASSNIDISESDLVSEVMVKVDISHTYIGDLVVTLAHAGTTVTLHDKAGGGTADLVMRLAKEAIARPVGQRNQDPEVAKMEVELEEAINATGIGPQGLGGDITTLAVHIETAHTHITQNPVAVNTQCWPARRSRARIFPDGKVEYGY